MLIYSNAVTPGHIGATKKTFFSKSIHFSAERMYGFMHDDLNNPILLSEWMFMQLTILENPEMAELALKHREFFVPFDFFHFLYYYPIYHAVLNNTKDTL